MNIRLNLENALKRAEDEAFLVGCSIEERYPDTSDPQELLELHELYMRLQVAGELLANVRQKLPLLDRYLE